MKQLAVIGAGYVGLVAGAGFAELGHDVVCVDIDQAKIETLKSGQIPFYEPGLEDLVRRNMKDGRLAFSTSIQEGVRGKDAIFLAVGTPSKPDGSADLSVLFEAAGIVFENASPGRGMQGLTVVVKSTVPVGTNERLQELADQKKQCKRIGVVSNPEFLKEGDAVNDFMKPERVIIGGQKTDVEIVETIYAPLMLRENRVIKMDAKSAELTKYACNAMLATRISFMNEMANLCEEIGANVDLVRQGMASDSRIGSKFLYPGVGFGGSCFGKDLKALVKFGDGMLVAEAALYANEYQLELMFKKLYNRFWEAGIGKLHEKTVAIWGAAFKPRTDDIRDAPAVALIQDLMKSGVKTRIYDRAALPNIRQKFPADQFPNLTLVEDEYAVVDGADALVLMTEWAEFRQPDWAEVAKRMKGRAVFDGRNIWNPKEVIEAGFSYEGIGRPAN